MIIKSADDRTLDLAILKSLSERGDALPDVKTRIEKEIRNLQAGIRGEKEAAYEIDFHFGPSKNWMVLHDIRLECGGRVAQIDHLLINRFLDIYLCESKHFSEGIAVNDHGEFAAFYGGKPYGVPSPIEQNRRHAAVLDSLFQSGSVALPTRLGFALKPTLLPLVLVSKGARISRPKGAVAGLDTVIKNDQLKARIEKDIDAMNNPLVMAKLVAPDTLEVFARRLVASHRPIPFDWPARFGLPGEPPPSVASRRSGFSPAPAASPASVSIPGPGERGVASGEGSPKHRCSSCGAPVTYAVAKFCWFNKPRFGGKVYCMECQKSVPK